MSTAAVAPHSLVRQPATDVQRVSDHEPIIVPQVSVLEPPLAFLLILKTYFLVASSFFLLKLGLY